MRSLGGDDVDDLERREVDRAVGRGDRVGDVVAMLEPGDAVVETVVPEVLRHADPVVDGGYLEVAVAVRDLVVPGARGRHERLVERRRRLRRMQVREVDEEHDRRNLRVGLESWA